ncbi:MAG: DUF6115 domain-containing protein [Lachnospiraceae bacterium]
MTAVEIIIVIVGIVLFIVSFILPVRKEELSSETKKLGEDMVRDMVNDRMKDVQSQIEDTVEETTNYAVEKAERAMERISNEKIMAVNEYSDTVLNEIHKNHEEVVFLYDMLNNKQQSLKNAVQEAAERQQKVEDIVNRAEETVRKQAEEPAAEEQTTAPKKTGQQSATDSRTEDFVPFVIERVEPPQKKSTRAPKGKPDAAALAARNVKAEKQTKNEEILRLHEEGKSNMAIAKELGLGIGEVKLVIDLYKGGLQ